MGAEVATVHLVETELTVCPRVAQAEKVATERKFRELVEQVVRANSEAPFKYLRPQD